MGFAVSSGAMTGRLFRGHGRQAAFTVITAVGVGFAAATVVRRDLSGEAFAWAGVQLGLAAIAAYDVATRRIRNYVTLPGSILAVVLRAVFERNALVEVIVAGIVVFVGFLALALRLPMGFGMGDVKLAGMLGFLLGSAVVAALLIGTVAGGVIAAAVLARSRSREQTIAYGPYLAFGAAVTILAFNPPDLF